MGGLKVPVCAWTIIFGALALSAVGIHSRLIGFAGFKSKDPIIEAAPVPHRFGAMYAFCARHRGRIDRILAKAPI